MENKQRQREVAKITEQLVYAKSSRREIRFVEKRVREKGLCEIRTASSTDPKSQAISVLKALGEGKVVKLSAVGDAANTKELTLGFVERMKNPYYNLHYKPLIDLKELPTERRKAKGTTDNGDKEMDTFRSMDTLIYDRNAYDDYSFEEDDEIIFADVLNNAGLIASNIKYYNSIGYDLTTMTDVVSGGRTSYLYLVYKKRK